MKNISVIIVKYKAAGLLKRCLASIPDKQVEEVIVIDNEVNNRGFGKAVNIGVKQAKGEYILILNPDCVLNKETIPQLLKRLIKKPKVAIVGPQLRDFENQPYLSFTKQPNKVNAWVVYSWLDTRWKNNQYSRDYWYQGRPLNKPLKVESISGAAMMMRKKDFLDVGGFDERFFMYWEDYDLCARMMAVGKEIWFEPKAYLLHLRAGSTQPDSLKVKRWFWQSRYRFFKKYFGRGYGTLVAAGLWIQEEWQFSLIFVLALWLRFWRLPELMPWLGDQGRDFLAALEALQTAKLPLLGIESSVPRFAQGPLYVWGIIGLLMVGLKDPIWAGLAAAFTGLASVVATYFLVYHFFYKKVAIVSMLILATSPLVVAQARLAFMTNPIPLVSVFYLFNLLRPYQNYKNLFWLGFSFALLFQFELAVLPLGLLIVWYVWYYREKIKKRAAAVALILGAFLLGMLPQVVFDITHKFRQLSLFMVWVVYRIAAFGGWDSEHAVSVDKLQIYLGRLWLYLGRYFIWGRPGLSLFYFILLLAGLTVTFKFLRQKKLVFGVKVAWLWISILILAFMVHSAPSEAYFPVLFVPLAILLSWSANNLPSKIRPGLYLCLVIAAVYNSWFLLTRDFLMTTPANVAKGYQFPYGTPLATQKKLVKEINQSSSGPVRIIYQGEGKDVPHFLDGYYYLALMEKVNLSDDGEKGVNI